MDVTAGTNPVAPGVSDQAPEVPFKTTSLVNHRVLVLSPHQDDESLACGGALILHRQNLDPVKVVFLTDGGRGDQRNEYRPEDYVSLRQHEARRAGQILGVTDLEFWDFPDGGLIPAGEPLERLSQLLGSYRPTLVYAPSPLEFHPDHRAAAALLWQAIQHRREKVDIAFFEYNRPILINTLVDVTSVIEQKRRACDVYQSQLANYPYTDCAVGLNRYRALTVSSVSQYAEGYFLLGSREVFGRPIETFTLNQLLPAAGAAREPAPLVSIIVRTKDRPALLRQALSSIRAQTQPNLEVIVVNDGGEDVAGIIAQFARDLDVRYCSHGRSAGRGAAANAGLRTARGKYIGFLDDDDLLHPQHVEKLVTFLEKTGEQAAYSDCEIGHYQWEGGELRLVTPKAPYKGVDFDRDRLHFGNYIPVMTAMFRRRLLKEVEPFDESLECLEDWDFWLRLSARTSFYRLPGVTAEYRVLVGRNYDWARWSSVVYRKHEQHWTLNDVARVWPRIEAAFERREADLRGALGQERHARQAEEEARRADQEARRQAEEALHFERVTRHREHQVLRDDLQAVYDSHVQRVARLVRACTPHSVVLLFRRLVARAERLDRPDE